MPIVTEEIGNTISDWIHDATTDEIVEHMDFASLMQERPSYRDRDDED